MSKFIFADQIDTSIVQKTELPVGVKTPDILFRALYNGLSFPDYFGGNWNALDECIRDLSWLPPGDVCLIHRDLPLTNDSNSLSIYLSILHDAIENWDTNGSNLIYACPDKWDSTGDKKLLVNRKLFVLFPPDTQNAVEKLVAHGNAK